MATMWAVVQALDRVITCSLVGWWMSAPRPPNRALANEAPPDSGNIAGQVCSETESQHCRGFNEVALRWVEMSSGRPRDPSLKWGGRGTHRAAGDRTLHCRWCVEIVELSSTEEAPNF